MSKTLVDRWWLQLNENRGASWELHLPEYHKWPSTRSLLKFTMPTGVAAFDAHRFLFPLRRAQ